MRWLRSLHVQLFLWAIMPVTFVLIAFSFTGVYSHQQMMRDFVVERDAAMARLLAQVAGDGLAHGVVGGDGRGLAEWLALAERDLPGTVMVIGRAGIALVHSLPDRLGANVQDSPGIAQALTQREGFVIVQDGGAPVLVTFSPVEGTEWTVVIREPVEDLIGPLLRFPSLIPAIAIGAGVLSLLILVFGWWTIVRPLQQLSRAAEQVSWGDYTSIERPVQGVQEARDLQRALTEMVERIRDYETGIRDYLSAVTRTQEAERARLARELHDGPIQTLIALGQRAEMVKRLVARKQLEQVQTVLEELYRTEQDTIRELRRIVGALRPIYLEDLGFVPALEMLVRQSADRTDAEIHLDIGERVHRLSPDVELAAYRIAQEALANAIRHAGAKHITFQVQCENDTLILTVADDGIGFAFPSRPHLLTREGHFGLLGMQERVASLGGTLRIYTAPDQGTRVVARLPNRPAVT